MKTGLSYLFPALIGAVCISVLSYQEIRISKTRASLTKVNSLLLSSTPHRSASKSLPREQFSEAYSSEKVNQAVKEFDKLFAENPHQEFSEITKITPDILQILVQLTKKEAADAIANHLNKSEADDRFTLVAFFSELFPYEIFESLPQDDPWSDLGVKTLVTLSGKDPEYTLQFIEEHPFAQEEEQIYLRQQGSLTIGCVTLTDN